MNCRLEIVEKLIQHGANLNYEADDGLCAFNYACYWKQEKVIEALIQKYNADIFIKWNGKTGLQHLQYEDEDMYDRIL